MSPWRALYTLLVMASLPFALIRLAWRGRRQPGYRHHVPERLGFYPAPAAALPVLWVHAVSVGETQAAQPLVEALERAYPGHPILLTHMTPTGRETSERLFGGRVLRAYLPYDLPWALAGFLNHFRPCIGLLLETEVWPNLVAACQQRGVPLYLVNARLSVRSCARYRRVLSLARETFGAFRAIGAQSAADAQRLQSLGGTAVVTGNLKFDRGPAPADWAFGHRLRRWLGEERRVFLAASTRDGEEALLLDALAGQSVPGLLLVIVPRHPQRFEEVAALLQRRGVVFSRRSSGNAPGPEVSAVLGDSMGELFGYFAACDVAFVGGSLLPLGGQNLLEACAVGRAVLVGPHTFNFVEATRLAIEAGAALQLGDADALIARGLELLRRPERARAMGEAGLAFLDQHRGATGRTLELLAPGLPRPR